jgi:hypothetical protein
MNDLDFQKKVKITAPLWPMLVDHTIHILYEAAFALRLIMRIRVLYCTVLYNSRLCALAHSITADSVWTDFISRTYL